MRFGPKSSFVCLIPPPPKEPPPVEDTPTDVATPVHSWSLLQPLSGKCLYVSPARHLRTRTADNMPPAQARLVHILVLP